MVERVHRLGLTTRRMPFHEASLAVLDAREAGVKVDWPECSCEACTWLAGLPG